MARLVVAVSLPTRAFAASLVATGAVARLAERPASDDVASHLAYLRGLPPGTTVTHRFDSRRKRTAELRGIKAVNGQEYIVLQEGNGPRYVPSQHALRIEVSRHQRRHPPRVAQVRTIRTNAGLAAGLNDSVTDFLAQSRLGVVLVGSDARLRAELEAPLGIELPSGAVQPGQLQDLARVRRFGRDGEGYRSELVPFEVTDGPLPLRDAPTLTVFDGARSFLHGARRWPDTNWVVILDRSEPRYEEGCAEIDRLYTTRRSQAAVALILPTPPAAVEYTAFGVEGA